MIILIVAFTPLVPRYTMRSNSWYEDPVQYPLQYFSTTKWLAFEAVKLATEPYEYQWLTSLWGNHLNAFFSGVAAPTDSLKATGYANPADYGDIGAYRLYLDDAGVVVTENNLSVRAQEEYDKLVDALNQTDPDEGLCAFYAGATAHYVAQAGTWGAIWDETTSWGPITNFALVWSTFESQIESGIQATYAIDPATGRWTQSNWYNNYLSISPAVIAPKNASEATIELAKNIHPLAEDLGKNLTSHVVIGIWPTQYKADVESCLEYSAEAIFSFLQQALIDVNWKYIDIPVTTIDYNQSSNHFNIDNFQVEYVDSIGPHILNDSVATEASFRFAYYPTIGSPSLGTDVYDLSYNGGTDTWYFDDILINGTVARTQHKVFYTFNMNGTTQTWSKGDESFTTDFLYINFSHSKWIYGYDPSKWELNIWNLTAKLENVPEIGFIEPYEVDSAEWFLYQKGVGGVQPGTEPIGVLGVDTENHVIKGDLLYETTNNTWYCNETDIGWFHTPETFDNYVVVRFRISRLPIGYTKINNLNQTSFVNYAQATGTHYFRTRFHKITISPPTISYDPETKTVDVFNITARTDYTNTTYDGTIDYFEIHQKVIPAFMTDTREATVKIYLFDGIQSNTPPLGFTDLSWDPVNEWWYYDDIDVSSLPDNWYYAAANIKNMNVNVSVASVGSPSELFRIVRPVPVIYFILPEIFLAGFVVLFGWLAWWRPRRKKLQIEREREEKLDKGYMD